MSAAPRIQTILFGFYDLRPFSRAEFLAPALKFIFIRQLIVIGLCYLIVQIVESPNTPELLQLLLAVVVFIFAMCLLITYYILMYKRLLGSILPLPRLIICADIVLNLFFSTFDQSFLEGALIDFIWGGIIYLILFLLPDRRALPCRQGTGEA